jgi:hypothetical protein
MYYKNYSLKLGYFILRSLNVPPFAPFEYTKRIAFNVCIDCMSVTSADFTGKFDLS